MGGPRRGPRPSNRSREKVIGAVPSIENITVSIQREVAQNSSTVYSINRQNNCEDKAYDNAQKIGAAKLCEVAIENNCKARKEQKHEPSPNQTDGEASTQGPNSKHKNIV